MTIEEIDELKERARKPPKKITDDRGRTFFDDARRAIVDSATAVEAYRRADEARFEGKIGEYESAYTYLALGLAMAADDSIGVPGLTATDVLHFAGHGLRELGQAKRAADAYDRAGALSFQGRLPQEIGIRSYARAKSCAADVGDAQLAEQMHVREWEARRLDHIAKYGRAPILTMWRVTSRYGTSLRRWAISLLAVVVFFAALYVWLHHGGWIAPADWHSYTPLYLALATTLGYGDVGATRWIPQLVVVLNVASAYVLLGVGATILGGKVLGR